MGKIVFDINNYYFECDGYIEVLDKGEIIILEFV